MTDAVVLGLPGWQGRRGMVIRGGTSSVETGVLHSYTFGDRRAAPVVVFAQSIATPQQETAVHALLGRGDRPESASRVAESPGVAQIQGAPLAAVFHTWSDPRIAEATFRWNDHFVSVASWMYPLDEEFFSTVGPLT